jgi:hypothetical protein
VKRTCNPRLIAASLAALALPGCTYLGQSGLSRGLHLGLTVDSLNGVRNRSATKLADPRFNQALALVLQA